jgi:general secretion pathway protein H
MPTSPTGTSNNRIRGRPAAPRTSGFTLLEVLVVVVIIGIIASMAVVSTRVLGGDHEMDQEARRLSAVLAQAREEAMLQGRDVGLRVDGRGYDFLLYDNRNEIWRLADDDPLLRERVLPEGLEARLWLESREVKLAARSAPSEQSPAIPQVVVFASGDAVPFELRIERAGTRELRAVVGRIDGTVEVLANDDVERR